MSDTRPQEGRLPLRCLLPNTVTILGLGAGLTSLRFVYSGNFQLAAALIVLAALIDGLDGLVARRLNATSAFGAELDSLSDFLNFGVAPAFLVYRFALADAPGIAWTAALAYAICCCLRLARFNVNRGIPTAGRAHFVGVPAPAGALLAMLPILLAFAGLVEALHPVPVAVWLGAVGMLMVTRLRTFSPKSLRAPEMRWALLAVAIVAPVAFFRFWHLMVLADAVYLVLVLHAAVAAARGGRLRPVRGHRGD